MRALSQRLRLRASSGETASCHGGSATRLPAAAAALSKPIRASLALSEKV